MLSDEDIRVLRLHANAMADSVIPCGEPCGNWELARGIKKLLDERAALLPLLPALQCWQEDGVLREPCDDQLYRAYRTALAALGVVQ